MSFLEYRPPRYTHVPRNPPCPPDIAVLGEDGDDLEPPPPPGVLGEVRGSSCRDGEQGRSLGETTMASSLGSFPRDFGINSTASCHEEIIDGDFSDTTVMENSAVSERA
jgi:hypothetical protein